MANPKYVTLGEKAASFSCPTTGIALSGKDIIQLTPKMLRSEKIIQALRGGHLIYCGAPGEDDDEDEEEDDNGNFTEGALKKMKKEEIRVIAVNLLDDEDEEDEGEINGYNKDELIDFVLSKQPSDE